MGISMAKMAKKRVDGIVIECYTDLRYRVELTTGEQVNAYTAGKMKLHKIKVILGDKVELELDEYGGNATNRIIKRYRQ
jgi:translation initiation factor IF-1